MEQKPGQQQKERITKLKPWKHNKEGQDKDQKYKIGTWGK